MVDTIWDCSKIQLDSFILEKIVKKKENKEKEETEGGEEGESKGRGNKGKPKTVMYLSPVKLFENTNSTN